MIETENSGRAAGRTRGALGRRRGVARAERGVSGVGQSYRGRRASCERRDDFKASARRTFRDDKTNVWVEREPDCRAEDHAECENRKDPPALDLHEEKRESAIVRDELVQVDAPCAASSARRLCRWRCLGSQAVDESDGKDHRASPALRVRSLPRSFCGYCEQAREGGWSGLAAAAVD